MATAERGGGERAERGFAAPLATGIWLPSRSDKITAALLVAAVLVSYLPSVLFVFGIENDYDHLYYKTSHFLSAEAPWLFFIARPVAALFANLTILPIDSVAGLRWYRCFSILTMALIAFQLSSVCAHHLRIRGSNAIAVGVALLLAPGLYYAVMDASAWVPHIVSIWVAVGSYAVLSRSNAQTITLYVYARRRELRRCGGFLASYARCGPVLIATALLQFGLYDYPPDALAIAIFPVAIALLSEAPLFYRLLLCARDFIFIAANLVLYFLSAKLIYFPVAKSVYSFDQFRVLANTGSEYKFGLASSLHDILTRLVDVAKVAGDLWFLPQYQGWIVSLGLAVLVCLFAVLRWLPRKSGASFPSAAARTRVSREVLGSALLGIGAFVVFYLMAASPIIISAGGFAAYRTVVVPTAMTAIAVVYLLRSLTGMLLAATNRGDIIKQNVASGAVTALIVCAAIGATDYQTSITIRLARNEFDYTTNLIRDAHAKGAASLVVLDPRDTFFPQDIPVTYDEQGRPIVPYELGCFSLYCFTSKALYMEALLNSGLSTTDLHIEIFRGALARKINCAAFKAGAGNVLGDDFAREARSLIVSRGPVDCVNYRSIWRDLSYVARGSG